MEVSQPEIKRNITLSISSNATFESLIDALQKHFTIEIQDLNHFILNQRTEPLSTGGGRYRAMQSTTEKQTWNSSQALKKREENIMHLLAEGQTYEQIAENLGMTINGVRYHIKKIYRLLGATNAREAIAVLGIR